MPLGRASKRYWETQPEGKINDSHWVIRGHTCAPQQRAEASFTTAEAKQEVDGATGLQAIAVYCLVIIELLSAVDETLDGSRNPSSHLSSTP